MTVETAVLPTPTPSPMGSPLRLSDAINCRYQLPLTTGATQWVQLHGSQGEFFLACFENKNDKNYKFLPKLQNAHLVNNTTEKGPCLFLICPNGEFEFQANSKEMYRVWLEIFIKCGVKVLTFDQLYNLKGFIGEGSFAKVYIGRHSFTNEEVVVKEVDKKKVKDSNIYTEIEVLRKISHPYIIRLFAAYEKDETICLVLEYLRGGELFDWLSENGPYTEAQAKQAMRRVLQGLQCLHQHGIVHRDLKTENLILEQQNNPTCLKIIDFGLASTIGSPTMRMRCGSPGYVAPEILEDRMYGVKVDVFSAGVILFTLLAGYPPFRGSNVREILKKNLQCRISFNHPRWSNVSSVAMDLILWMTHRDPDRRCSAFQALTHPWFERLPTATMEEGRKLVKSTTTNNRRTDDSPSTVAPYPMKSPLSPENGENVKQPRERKPITQPTKAPVSPSSGSPYSCLKSNDTLGGMSTTASIRQDYSSPGGSHPTSPSTPSNVPFDQTSSTPPPQPRPSNFSSPIHFTPTTTSPERSPLSPQPASPPRPTSQFERTRRRARTGATQKETSLLVKSRGGPTQPSGVPSSAAVDFPSLIERLGSRKVSCTFKMLPRVSMSLSEGLERYIEMPLEKRKDELIARDGKRVKQMMAFSRKATMTDAEAEHLIEELTSSVPILPSFDDLVVESEKEDSHVNWKVTSAYFRACRFGGSRRPSICLSSRRSSRALTPFLEPKVPSPPLMPVTPFLPPSPPSGSSEANRKPHGKTVRFARRESDEATPSAAARAARAAADRDRRRHKSLPGNTTQGSSWTAADAIRGGKAADGEVNPGAQSSGSKTPVPEYCQNDTAGCGSANKDTTAVGGFPFSGFFRKAERVVSRRRASSRSSTGTRDCMSVSSSHHSTKDTPHGNPIKDSSGFRSWKVRK